MALFILGFILAYIFFLTIILTAFGGKNKYWWIGIALVPAAVFEFAFDLPHLYFSILVGLAGWLLGKGLEFAVLKIKAKKV